MTEENLPIIYRNCFNGNSKKEKKTENERRNKTK